MNPEKAKVVDNREVAPGIYRLALEAGEGSGEVAPGRFFMIGVGLGFDPLLRRPLSLLDQRRGKGGGRVYEFLYEVRGKGTRALARLSPPASISFIGPLGNGWTLDPIPPRLVMVAGGMGAVPLYAAAGAVARAGRASAIEFIYGARTGECMALASEVEGMPCATRFCTEDGCLGEKGLATALLSQALEGVDPSGTVILACGPRAMLKETARISAERNIPCQVSLEARMGCGMGACLTCSIRGADGSNLRVCREGPVFAADKIDWEALDDIP